MSARTTLIDRRLAAAVLEGISPDLPEEVVKHHLTHLADLHRAIGEVLWAPMPHKFALGVLERVRSLPGQLAQARLTQVPGGETFGSQRRNQVIKFYTDWHFNLKEGEELIMSPTLGSEVIYLPDVVEGSLCCTFDKVKVEGRDSVQDILDRLPTVYGLRWIVGNPPAVCRVLANHLKETGEYLLPNVHTWTDGINQLPYGLNRLIVGCFRGRGVCVNSCHPGRGDDCLGLFVLGVPA